MSQFFPQQLNALVAWMIEKKKILLCSMFLFLKKNNKKLDDSQV